MCIDLFLIIVICLYSAIGFKKGILNSLISIISFTLSLLLTYLLIPTITNYLNKIINYENIQNFIINHERIDYFVNNNDKLSYFVRFLLHIKNNNPIDTAPKIIIDLVIFILVNIVLRIIIKMLLTKLFKAIKKAHQPNLFDKMSGTLIGFIKGFFVSCLLCLFILSINGTIIKNTILNTQIENSVLITTFSNSTQYIIQTISNYFN